MAVLDRGGVATLSAAGNAGQATAEDGIRLRRCCRDRQRQCGRNCSVSHVRCVSARCSWLQVVWDNPALLPTFFPPLSDSSLREYDAGGEATGTFADLTAWRQRRRYHALRVPHNNVTAYGAAPAADRSVNPDLWHVIVTNTGGWIDDESTDVIPRYLLRAGCYPSPQAMPCPRSLVDDKACNGAGDCARQPCASTRCFVSQHSARHARCARDTRCTRDACCARDACCGRGLLLAAVSESCVWAARGARRRAVRRRCSAHACTACISKRLCRSVAATRPVRRRRRQQQRHRCGWVAHGSTSGEAQATAGGGESRR